MLVSATHAVGAGIADSTLKSMPYIWMVVSLLSLPSCSSVVYLFGFLFVTLTQTTLRISSSRRNTCLGLCHDFIKLVCAWAHFGCRVYQQADQSELTTNSDIFFHLTFDAVHMAT